MTKKAVEAVDVEKDVYAVVSLMDALLDDRSVPRNIRAAVEEAKNMLASNPDGVAVSRSMYVLDDISNDINMPSHSRTDLWNIISHLEALKEKIG
ncbi:MAG: UPF0147 family protein [Candidatus Diapherotrites archaeon]|nr:UPF0147 family protein [Candidatus Diapherotrites archaeon]